MAQISPPDGGRVECWPEPLICEDCCTDKVESLDPVIWQTIQDMAVSYLYSATGQRYGQCEVTVRPCRKQCGEYWGGLPIPWRVSGEWVNISCSTCKGECGCSGDVSEVDISQTYGLVSMQLDGDVYDSAELEAMAVVYDRHRIVRIDGEQWPGCQDLSSPGGPGTWSLTLLQGTPPPAGADVVAGILACEFGKACVADDSCRLPRRLQTISRQGVTAAFQDQFEGLSDMRTGVFEVDAWIEMARSTAWQAPRITSPDVPRIPVQTWPVMAS